MARKKPETETFRLYQSGKDYNYKLNYYSDVNRNEDFYAGDQWRGIKAKGMPTPVFNIFKRVINFFISWILSSKVKAQYTAKYVGTDPQNDDEQRLVDASAYLTSQFDRLWEETRMDRKMREVLLNGAISGDMCVYAYWEDKDIGQDMKGDIQHQVLNGSQVMFGNPNCAETQKQPYIIIESRELVRDLIAEAKRNKQDVRNIVSDEETLEQTGSRGQIELDEKNKAQVFIKLWKEDGTIWAIKETQFATIRPKWNTKLSVYPIAWNNWDTRKSSYHGQAIGTGLIPNQIYINQLFAMMMIYWQLVGFPKVLFDKTRIDSWSNKIGAAIGVTGDVGGAAQYMNPSTLSGQILLSIEKAIEYTKEMLGMTDAFAGDVRPENTSAIVVITKQASVPLEGVKANLYALVEDLAYIDLEFMKKYYGKRKVKVDIMGKKKVVEFDFDTIKDEFFETKVDVGSSTYWSESASAQTLDNLLQTGRIEFIQYLKRMPDGMIPKRQELIDELISQDKRQMFVYEQMARFIETLPPQEQQRLQSLEEEEMEIEVIDMMMRGSPVEGVI